MLADYKKSYDRCITHHQFRVPGNENIYCGGNFERKIIQDIKESEKEVLVMFDFFSERIFEACCTAFSKGINVLIVYDKMAINRIGNKFLVDNFINKYLPSENLSRKLIKSKIALICSFSISIFFFEISF